MEANNAVPPDTEPRRSTEDMLKELVDRIRRIDRQADAEIPFGPIYFTKDYVDHGSRKTYPQGRRGVVLREHKLRGRVTHLDLRLTGR
jgi:hypothetical protein